MRVSHKAQGLTVDRTLVLAGDDLTRERGHTALSRGRIENSLYLVATRLEYDHHHLERPEPTDVLRRMLQRSDAQELAIDQGSSSTFREVFAANIR